MKNQCECGNEKPPDWECCQRCCEIDGIKPYRFNRKGPRVKRVETRHAKQRRYQKALYKKRRRRGLCVKCGAEANGKVRCPVHALIALEYRRFTRKDVKRHGTKKNPKAGVRECFHY